MAQYKVPQDVEADDKLLGPFSFRQFVYLLIAGGLIAVAVGLFQLFPLLALIPLPPVLLFLALALPLKKDQPMEAYLAAVASYYLKPRNRVWMSGQRESTVEITAPKKMDDDRLRDITGEEATHRLSFLADIVDTEGYAIKGAGANHVSAELVEEAMRTPDMFEAGDYGHLDDAIAKDENERHKEAVRGMREEIAKSENIVADAKVVKKEQEVKEHEEKIEKLELESPVVVVPDAPVKEKITEKSNKPETKSVNPGIIELANNPDFSVATIAKEANRIKEKEEGEVFISLH